ncbi:MAG: copper resistance protein CopC, partial [Micrococcales bacterium]|nr:copper resistance protein CopC [Micrococcales bacterium]
MRKFTISALVLGLLTLSSPVFAHDELETTSPIAGATVEAGVIPITLTFSEPPLDLPYGQGNLIAIADNKTKEQLGPACAKVEGSVLSTVVHISTPGEYKILWRVAADDGHVNSGDFTFTVVNNSNYSTDTPGNQCFDENGQPLDISKQELLSTKVQPDDGMVSGIFWALG